MAIVWGNVGKKTDEGYHSCLVCPSHSDTPSMSNNPNSIFCSSKAGCHQGRADSGNWFSPWDSMRCVAWVISVLGRMQNPRDFCKNANHHVLSLERSSDTFVGPHKPWFSFVSTGLPFFKKSTSKSRVFFFFPKIDLKRKTKQQPK